MRLSKLYIVIGVATSTVVGLAGTQSVLRLTGKVGDVREFKLVANFATAVAGQQVTAKVTADISRKVTHVEPDGTITLQETRSQMTIDYNGTPMSQPNAIVVKVLKPDGTAAELRGEAATPEAYRAITLSTVKLPDFPMAKDKTWTWDVPADAKRGIVKAKAEYTVLGDEKLHDIDTWKIACSVVETEGASPASNTSTVWISKSDASLVKSESTVKNLPLKDVGPLSGTQSLNMTS